MTETPGTPTILALAASPRVGGNTERLLDAFLEAFAAAPFRTEKLHLARLSIAPCDGCGECLADGRCVKRDDMDLVYDGLARAAALVFATPVHFLGVTAQAKAVIDRCQSLWVAKYRLERPIAPRPRPGAFVSTAGGRAAGMFDCPLKVVRAFFAAAQFRLVATVLEDGLDEMEEEGPDPRLEERARVRGAEMRRILESGTLMGPSLT